MLRGMAESAPETRGDWALRRLRSAILTGEFPPGTKLRAEELAERWQVSPTPLREAFQRLGGAGLVEVSPQRGVRVAEFTLEDAADLYALRLRLEPAALRHSLRKSDDAHRREIANAFARLAAARTLDAGAEAHLAFHAALLARCPSAWTRHIVAELAEHAQRYALLGAQRYRDSDPRREHRALRDAALAGQVDAAVELLTKHLRGTLDSVRAAMDAAPRRARQAETRSLRAAGAPRGVPMNRDERREFVRKHRTAVLGYARKSDGPAQSIVYYVSDGDDLLVSTMGARAKAKAVAPPRQGVAVRARRAVAALVPRRLLRRARRDRAHGGRRPDAEDRRRDGRKADARERAADGRRGRAPRRPRRPAALARTRPSTRPRSTSTRRPT